MSALVVMKDICKVFDNQHIQTKALQGVDLTLYQGDFLAITGPSGGGKSTLLSVMGLMDESTSGEYQLLGNQTSQLGVDQRNNIRNKHIGFVFQSFNLIDRLTVFDNVALPLQHRKMKKRDILPRVEDALNHVGMGSRWQHYPNQLSGGQQQRIAIARALVGEPDLMLLDEPTGNLDSQNGDQVMQLLIDLNSQGKTMVMVTHDEQYAGYAKRKIRLLDGKIVSQFQSRGEV